MGFGFLQSSDTVDLENSLTHSSAVKTPFTTISIEAGTNAQLTPLVTGKQILENLPPSIRGTRNVWVPNAWSVGGDNPHCGDLPFST